MFLFKERNFTVEIDGRGRAAGTEKKPQVLVYNLNLLLCCFSTMGTI